jgi:hypothetical protein
LIVQRRSLVAELQSRFATNPRCVGITMVVVDDLQLLNSSGILKARNADNSWVIELGQSSSNKLVYWQMDAVNSNKRHFDGRSDGNTPDEAVSWFCALVKAYY